MTDRSLYFFMLRKEVCAIIEELPDASSLFVLAEIGGRPARYVRLQSHEIRACSAGTMISHLYLAPRGPDHLPQWTNVNQPGAWGMINLALPSSDGRSLFMSQMVMRTHPSQDLAVGDEQSRVRLFDRIRSRMRTRLSRPVFARGTAGGPTRTYRDIGYSEGAREWVLAGGELRDRPAINVKFLLAPEDA